MIHLLSRIGISGELIKGIRHFDRVEASGSTASWNLGALYRFTDSWVAGISFFPPFDVGPDSNASTNLSGFNQSILSPGILGLGLGFMPNRFFKAGISILAVGGTQNTALLYDQNIAYGKKLSFQPRIGASYVFFEYPFLSMELALGLYDEVSRIEAQDNRFHKTFALDVNPWFINTGIGADGASHYYNWIVSLGVDVVRTLRTFEIIPKDPVPNLKGSFPSPITRGQSQEFVKPTLQEVKQIIIDIPEKI